jgi:hypothetical protein
VNLAYPLADYAFEQRAADTQRVEAAFASRMFSLSKPPMRVAHRIDEQTPGIDRVLEQARKETFQSVQASGKKTMRVPALRHAPALVPHFREAVAFDNHDLVKVT